MPNDATMRALLDRVAAERPEAPFLIDPERGRTVTFAELRARVARSTRPVRAIRWRTSCGTARRAPFWSPPNDTRRR
jgi:hypothetical protein